MRRITATAASQTVVAANREKYDLVRDGVQVSYRDDKGKPTPRRLRVLDFDDPDNNHFLCVREMWVRGDLYRRRADIIGFVNGLPLLFIECKNIHRDLKTAFEENYADYRDTVPHLFHHNAVVMFGNGEKARIGSIVDYCGIPKHLRKALATFAGTQPDGDGGKGIDPARPDEELLADLAESNAMVRSFLKDGGAPLDDVIRKEGFARNAAIVACKEVANGNDETRKRFEVLRREDKTDTRRIKTVAKELLRTLKAEKLRVDQWREKEATQSAVKVAIHAFLYSDETGLPDGAYSNDDVTGMSEAVFAHVYRAYPTVPSPFYDDATAA